jgi:hypothetical protein
MRIMDFLTIKTRFAGKVDRPLLFLNAFLLLLTVGSIIISDAHSRRTAQAAALNDNVFLTTEWRLLKELKDRTDRLLIDKDREIEELRKRYQTLQGQKAAPLLLEAIEAELAKAESERDAILSARLLPGSTAAAAANPVLVSAAPARLSDSSLTALLRDKIRALEEELASGRRDANAILKERDSLQLQLEASLAQPGAPSRPQESPAPPDADAYLALLQKKRDELAGTAPALSLSDLRTRTLLRAIVRTPAIQAEYPSLSADLDRYFQVYGEAERHKAVRDSYEELIAAMGALTGKVLD